MTELPEGWTLDRLAQIANHVARHHPMLFLDLEEARDVAAVALVERLFGDPTPTADDMFAAARYAVTAANRQETSHVDRNSTRSGREGTPPGYARYWYSGRALVTPWEDELLDRYAAQQVWAALSPRHRETLAALAEQGSYAAAREALGWTTGHWNWRLRTARMEARRLWYLPEEPAPQWGHDRPGHGLDKAGRNRGIRNLARKRWTSTQRETAR